MGIIGRRTDVKPVNTDELHRLRQERLFLQGVRQLQDLIAAGQSIVKFDHMILDNRFIRVLAITDWPRFVSLGWLDPLLLLPQTIDVSLHIDPMDPQLVMQLLDRQHVKVLAQFQHNEETGQITRAEHDVQYSDLMKLRRWIAEGSERLFSVRLYIAVSGTSQEELAERHHEINTALAACQLKSRPLYLEQQQGFHAVLPEGISELEKPRRNIQTSALATIFPFNSSNLSMNRGIYYGDNVLSNSMIFYDRFAGTNYNMVVLGTAGGGKSYIVKTEAVQSLMTGVDYYIIDPDAEYSRMAEGIGGQVVRISPTSRQHINPFDITTWTKADDDDDASDPLTEKVLHLSSLIDLMTSDYGVGNELPQSTLSVKDRALIQRALFRLYAARGITHDSSTHNFPRPVLKDFIDLLDQIGGPARDIALKLERFATGALSGMFNSATNVDLQKRCVVFDIQSLGDQLKPIAMSIITDFIWSQVRTKRKKRILVIDEVWQLLRHPASAEFIRGTVKRARKYWLGVTCITQDVSDFVNSDTGRPVVTNSEMTLLLRQKGASLDLLTEVFGLSEPECQILESAGRGEGILIVEKKHAYLKVPRQPDEVHRLITTDPSEVTRIEEERRRERANQRQEENWLQI